MTRAAPSAFHTLGPAGTFSDRAARIARAHLGASQVSICFEKTVPNVFRAVMADATSYGVIPIENSEAGTIAFAQDELAQHEVQVLLELLVPVRFSLIASAPLRIAEALYVQPIALAQCSKYLDPYLEISVETASNIQSRDRFLEAQSEGRNIAAVVPVEEALAFGPLEVARDIQTSANNLTRFLVIAKGNPVRDYTKKKTSVVVCPEENRSGLLHDILVPLKHHGLNLCRLESRPSHQDAWHYAFFMDFENGPESAEAVRELEREGWGTRVLGCYDTVTTRD